MDDVYILKIVWVRSGLPPYVGPFRALDEAEEWARLNVPNGEWRAELLVYPYMEGKNDE